MSTYTQLENDAVSNSASSRVRLDMPGRCLLESKYEHDCMAAEMSAEQLAVVLPTRPPIGAPVVVYIDIFGRLAGNVSKLTPFGFEMTLRMPQAKREKLAAQLEWHARRAEPDRFDKRQNERIVPLTQIAVMRLGGFEHIVKINDISCDGANIESAYQPPVGMRIVVGSSPAVVVRHSETGFACQFETPFDMQSLDGSMRL